MYFRVKLLGLAIVGLPWIAAAGEPPAIGTFDAVIVEMDEVEVAAQERGLIVDFPVHIGELVESGDLLGRIDDAAARIQRDLAESELDIAVHQQNDLSVQRAEKAIGLAEADLARAEDANVDFDNTVSESEINRLRFVRDSAVLDRLQAELDQQELELTVGQRQHSLALAQLALERRMVHAPLRGTVIEVLRHVGEWVEPGETVARILNTDIVRARALVNVSAVPVNVTGHPVRLTLSTPNGQTRRFEGTVVFSELTVNLLTGEYSILAEIENPDRILRPGQQASITILPVSSESAAAGSESDPQ